jgi:DNA-binding IclR family transcriptional regulator
MTSLQDCSIIEHVIRTSNETVTPSQTLSRGLLILEAIALAEAPMTVTEIADAVGVHRSIAYRLIRTLEGHHLIERDEAGNYRPAAGLAVLARSVRLDLRTAAAPELRKLADELGMTAFVVIRDGADAVTVESAEPTSSNVHVVYRPGARHPIDRGAPGLALLLSEPPQPNERAELHDARELGWAQSTGEVLPGMRSIAAPVGTVGAVAVLWMSGQSVSEHDVATQVLATAKRIAATLH